MLMIRDEEKSTKNSRGIRTIQSSRTGVESNHSCDAAKDAASLGNNDCMVNISSARQKHKNWWKAHDEGQKERTQGHSRFCVNSPAANKANVVARKKKSAESATEERNVPRNNSTVTTNQVINLDDENGRSLA